MNGILFQVILSTYMNLFLFSMFKQFKLWLSKAQTTVAEPTLKEIPPSITHQLEKIIGELPYPSSYVTDTQEMILARLQGWQQEKEANSLVFLGSPVSEISSLITASLPCQQFKEANIIYPFSNLDIRRDPSQLRTQLKTAIKNATNNATIIVIPHLEQCFLRCIGGWDSIIWLRESIVNTPECFWLLGCNHWSWIFLDYVCQINAYLENTEMLPHLSGDGLREWLKPVADAFIPEESREQSSFWNTLASLSEGNSQVASQLWLHSIKMAVPQETKPHKQEKTDLKLTTPSLPKLPGLSPEERYILHALLLHGTIQHSYLAISLGEKEETIQGSIQILLGKELIQKQAKYLWVNPLHYPRIKQELAQNNFLIGED